MSKFNQQAMSNAVQEYEELYGNTPTQHPTHAVKERKNLAGGQSFSLSPELDLYSRVCTMGLSDKFYKSESDQMQELVYLIKRNTPSFVAKLAIYAREKMYLRSIPMVLAVELAKIHRGDPLVSRMVSRVIKRADEITEILAYYQKANDRDGQTKKLNKLSNQIKKGIREAFEDGRFDEYQFAKYNRGTEVKLRDAMFLTHPKPQDDAQKLLFDKIVEDKLDVPYTWEVQLSEAGQTGESKCAVWEQLIESNRLGYMALMRNIRNFLKEGVSTRHIDMVCDTIADKDKVLKSKQLPFRYLAAYRSLIGTNFGWRSQDIPDFVSNSPYLGRLLDSLETAISYSVDSLPIFQDNVLVATDVSGSMIQPVSPRSSVQMFDIGALLCMIAKKACKNSTAGMFGSDFKVLKMASGQILNNVQDIYNREGEVGYSTNGYKVLEWALGHNQGFDRIMMFTDCQLYNSNNDEVGINTNWKKYRAKYPSAKLYLFDLQGYGAGVPVQMYDNGVHLISGWSDKVFDILHRIEQGQSAVDEINSIQL